MTIIAHVRNFQALEDVTVEIDGFTVVTGGNNSGKTALMRATQGAVQNTRGSGYVRRGKKRTHVELRFEDGSIYWSKGEGRKSKPTYTINGGDPIYPGQAVPDEVRAFDIRPIRAGGRDVWPQIAPQFTGQVFLLDQPGSVLAEAVADVERVGRLTGAMALSEADRRQASNTLGVRRTDQETMQAEMEAFDGLDDAVALVAQAEATCASATRIGNAVAGLQDMKERLDAAKGEVDRLAGVGQVGVPASPTEAGTILDDLEELEDLEVRWLGARAEVDRLNGVELVAVEAPSIAKAERLLSGLGVVRGLKRRRDDALAEIDRIERELADKETQLADAESTVITVLADLGECPTCGTEMQEGHTC